MPNSIVKFLNFSRWLAAFAVVLSHVRHLIWVDFKDVENKTLMVKGAYFLSGFGHEAVVVFFVISGFLVGGLTWSRWKESGPAMMSYWIARFSRIYTVLIPALVVGLAIDLVGLKWFNGAQLYTNSAQYQTSSLSYIISDNVGVDTFLGNVFMLQNIAVGTLGSNGPLWSLSNEWWYYTIFAFGAAAIVGKGIGRWVSMGLAGLLLAVLPFKLLLWGGVWLLGLAGFGWVRSRKFIPHPFFAFPVLALALIFARFGHNPENLTAPESIATAFTRDVFVGFAFMFALTSVSHQKTRILEKLEVFYGLDRLHEALASFSYTTYLVHFPFMLFVVAVCCDVFNIEFLQQPTILSSIYLVAVILASYLWSYLFSLSFEGRTSTIRKWLLRVFFVQPIVPATLGDGGGVAGRCKKDSRG